MNFDGFPNSIFYLDLDLFSQFGHILILISCNLGTAVHFNFVFKFNIEKLYVGSICDSRVDVLLRYRDQAFPTHALEYYSANFTLPFTII